MCETVHRFHRHSGMSVMVEKRCARPTECTIESIGCEKLHSKHHRHQMVSTLEIFHAVLSSAVVVIFLFFHNQLFRKILSGTPSECQTVWVKIRPDRLLGQICVQSVCKGYEQTTQVGNEIINSIQTLIPVYLQMI